MQHEKLETSATLKDEKFDDLVEAAKVRVERIFRSYNEIVLSSMSVRLTLEGL